MTNPDAVSEALRLLGSRPDKIARRLQREGCTGVHSVSACPISVYLSANGFEDPWVTRNSVSWGPSGENIAALSDPVRNFIARFDAGKYPYLES